jgi:hypothetical protein
MSEPVKKFKRPAAQVVGFAELGHSGLKQTNGTIREEILRDLAGSDGIKKYKEMSDNDSTIGAILFAVGMLIRQAKWNVAPYKENDDTESQEGDKKNAEFVKSCMDDMSMTWEDVLSEVMTMLPFGWAYLET